MVTAMNIIVQWLSCVRTKPCSGFFGLPGNPLYAVGSSLFESTFSGKLLPLFFEYQNSLYCQLSFPETAWSAICDCELKWHCFCSSVSNIISGKTGSLLTWSSFLFSTIVNPPDIVLLFTPSRCHFGHIWALRVGLLEQQVWQAPTNLILPKAFGVLWVFLEHWF